MNNQNRYSESYTKEEVRKIIINMFFATTGYEPYEELVGYFTHIGINRTAEILCCYKQSPHIRNPLAWFKRAIADGYKPTDVPVKKDKKLIRQKPNSLNEQPVSKPVPFYNWLEDENNGLY